MRRRAIIATAAAGVLLLTACGTGGTAPEPDSTAEEVSTEVPQEEITLTLSYASDPPAQELVDGFTELHPNITIEMVETPFADYQTSLKLSLASDDAPDVVQYSPGPMRAIVPAGLVQPLDAYAEAYGWQDQVSPSLLGMLSSNESATQYGTGNLYAVPGAVQMVGVFYNKSLTADAGVTDEPTTLDEWEDDVETVADTGVTPVALPAFGVGGFQLWGALANVLADVDVFNAWVYGEPDTSLESDPGFAEAAATVQEWSQAGYFPPDASAAADEDEISAFNQGERAYYVTGNWNTQEFEEALGDDLGFFLVPGTSVDQPAVAMGSGFPYSMSSASEHKDAAAAFLNFMVNQESAPSVVEAGLIPVMPDEEITPAGAGATIQEDYLQVVHGAGIAPFANWATSSMIDTLTSGVQGLLSGNTAPEEYVASLQSDWESNRP